MTKIKICGITGVEEAEYLNEAEVDYAGFVFYEKSKRNVTVDRVKEIKKHLNPSIKAVAVVVDPKEALINELKTLSMDVLQVHGAMDLKIKEQWTKELWRAVNLKDNQDIKRVFTEPAQGYVLDGANYGGGVPFDWQGAERFLAEAKDKKIILAGGLCVENVTRGMEIFAPDIVDVSTHVEGTKGKDRKKIQEFVREVRAYDRK